MLRVPRLVTLASCLVIVAACSSSAGGSASTAPSSAPAASPTAAAATGTPAVSGSGAPPSASPAGGGGGNATGTPVSSATSSDQAGSSTGPTLLANVCDMLDVPTIASVTSLSVKAGKSIAADPSKGDLGSCLWAAGTTTGVQMTAHSEERIKALLLAPGTDEPGVGLAAKGRTATISGIIHASVAVDFGTFGVQIVTDLPAATLAMSVALAKAIP